MTKKEKEEQIKTLMENLEISREEALEVIAFDNGEVDNEEVAEIEQKIEVKKEKEKRSPLEKVKNQKAKKKADENKETIKETLFNFVKDSEIFVKEQEISATKISFQDKDGNFYTIALTKHKSRPIGYNYCKIQKSI